MTREWSRYYRHAALHDLEILHARFIEHRFARHSHEYYVIGVVEAGVQAYSYRGARHVTPAGHIFLVNPGEPHTGEAATHGGYVYRTVYPRPALMQQMTGAITVHDALPFFSRAVIRDDGLRERLLCFHCAVAEGAPSLSVESTLIDALAHLIRRYADDRRSRSYRLSERPAVRIAREYIDAHYDADVSLSELAALVQLSPFYFTRAFRKDVGLPPHAYWRLCESHARASCCCAAFRSQTSPQRSATATRAISHTGSNACWGRRRGRLCRGAMAGPSLLYKNAVAARVFDHFFA